MRANQIRRAVSAGSGSGLLFHDSFDDYTSGQYTPISEVRQPGFPEVGESIEWVTFPTRIRLYGAADGYAYSPYNLQPLHFRPDDTAVQEFEGLLRFQDIYGDLSFAVGDTDDVYFNGTNYQFLYSESMGVLKSNLSGTWVATALTRSPNIGEEVLLRVKIFGGVLYMKMEDESGVCGTHTEAPVPDRSSWTEQHFHWIGASDIRLMEAKIAPAGETSDFLL